MALPGGTARLSVSRTSDRDLKDRQVIVTLDGLPFATLLYGQRAARPISAGSHTLRVNNTLVWKTVAFEAVGCEDVHFSVVNRAMPGFFWMVALVGVGPIFVDVERVPGASGAGSLDTG